MHHNIFQKSNKFKKSLHYLAYNTHHAVAQVQDTYTLFIPHLSAQKKTLTTSFIIWASSPTLE